MPTLPLLVNQIRSRIDHDAQLRTLETGDYLTGDSTMPSSTGTSSAALTRRTFIAGTGAAGVLAATAVPASASGGPVLSNGDMRIRWQRSGQHWVTASVEVRQDGAWRRLFTPAGHYTVLVADEPPAGDDIKHGRAGSSEERRVGRE